MYSRFKTWYITTRNCLPCLKMVSPPPVRRTAAGGCETHHKGCENDRFFGDGATLCDSHAMLYETAAESGSTHCNGCAKRRIELQTRH